MDTSGRVSLIKILFFLMITSIFLGARATKNLSILFKTSCYEFQEHLNNPLSASLTVANKSDERCTWNMRKLLHLQKHAIVYKTNNMACAGGQVTFETDYLDKSVTENFCNQSKCLVFMRRESAKICNDSVLNETVPQIFADCRQFVSYIKPSTMKIVAEKSTRSFQLEYHLFNCHDEVNESDHTGESTVNISTPWATLPLTKPTANSINYNITRESTTTGGHAKSLNTTHTQVNRNFTEDASTTMVIHTTLPNEKEKEDKHILRGASTTMVIHTTLPNEKEKEDKNILRATSSWPPEAWKYLLPIILLTLVAIIVCIAYWLYSKSKSPPRRKEGKDEHISNIAL